MDYLVTSQPVQNPSGVTLVQPPAGGAQVVMLTQPQRAQQIYVQTPQPSANTAAQPVQMVHVVPVTHGAYRTPTQPPQNNTSVDVWVFQTESRKATGYWDFYER